MSRCKTKINHIIRKYVENSIVKLIFYTKILVFFPKKHDLTTDIFFSVKVIN
jgi:hypothetical protein